MRSLLVALALVAASYAFVAQKTIHPDPQAIVNKVNAGQNLWKASVKAKPIEYIKKKLMDVKYTHLPAGTPVHPEITTIKDADIPDSFDSRTNWPNCQDIGFIRDQSDCGSCWAFGAAEAMSDRTCIQSNGNVNVKLSADDILSCCGSKCGDGCEGGYPIEAWNFWVKTGVCTGGAYGDTTTCRPYEIPPCGYHGNVTYDPCPDDMYPTPACKKQCVAGYSNSYIDDKHFGASAAAVGKTVAAIQKEIMTNGPVEAAYTVYEDFYYYTGGIYKYQYGGMVGGHAVKILGWGTEGGVDYWLVANSWAPDWGESGYFRILRGTNECGIEHAIVAGMAKV